MKCFVLEATPTVSADGSTTLFLFGTHAWATSAADTPPNKPIRPLLDKPGTLRRFLFSKRNFSEEIEPDWGSTVLRSPAPNLDGPGVLDDWANYGIAGSSLVLRWGEVGAAYPAAFTTVWRAYARRHKADVGALTIWQRDGLQALEQAVVTAGFNGTGGLEGTGGAPKRRQQIFADPGYREVTLVDRIRQIYHVGENSSGGLQAQFQAFDNAIEIPREADYSSDAELLSSVPTAGYCRFYFGPSSTYGTGWKNGPNWVRLGSPPDGDVRVFGHGYPTDEDHTRRGSVVGSFFASHIALRAGVSLDRVDLTRDILPVGQQLIDGNESYIELLQDSARALHGFFGFTRDDKFVSGYLLDADDDGFTYGMDPTIFGAPPPLRPTTSLYTFTEAQLGDLSREPVAGLEVPQWSVAVRAGECDPSRIATGATDAMRDYLTREVWTAASGVSTSTKLAEPGADHLDVSMRGRYIQNAFGIRWWLERFFVLFGGRHHFYTFTVPMTEALLVLDLHDVVTLQTRFFGLSAGKKFRIVAIEIDCNANPPKMKFTVWGGTKGNFTPGGGGPPGGGDPRPDPALELARIDDFSGIMYCSAGVDGGAGRGEGFGDLGDFDGTMYCSVAGVAGEVVALFNFDGSDDSTTLTDDSGNALHQTGNTHIRCHSSQAKFGAAALKITRSDAALVSLSNSKFGKSANQPVGVDFWLYHVSSPNTVTSPPLFRWLFSNGFHFSLYQYGDTPKLQLDTNAFGDQTTPTSYTGGGWRHVRVQLKAGASPTIWVRVDGVLMFSGVAGDSSEATSGTLYFGLGGSSTTACEAYMDNFRVFKGYEFPDSDFTPPATAHTTAVP